MVRFGFEFECGVGDGGLLVILLDVCVLLGVV